MTTAMQETVKQTEVAPQEYLWTTDDFERASEAGALGRDRRLELIHGRIIDLMPVSPLHANLAEYLADCLRAVLPHYLKVREEKPVRLAFDTENVPDITVVKERSSDLRQQHPTPQEVALLVEVAISSAEYDLGAKARLYAQVGIADYWVVLPERAQVVVHREPTPNGYASVTTFDVGQSVAPLAAVDVALAVRDLLGLMAREDEGTESC